MDYIFLPIIFFLGLATSWEDLRIGKIRNIWILLGFILGTIFWAFFFVFSPQVNGEYLVRLGGNLFFASIVGFFMWKFRAWSAGDAKMLMLYSFLIPLSFYVNSYLIFFPSFVIIFNTFLILLFYLLFRSCVYGLKLTWQKKLNLDLQNNFKNAQTYFIGLAKFLPGFLLFMIVVSLSYKQLQDYISLNFFLYQIIAVTIIILFRDFLTRLFRKPQTNKIVLTLFLSLLSLGLYFDYEFTFLSMSNVFGMIFLFMIFFPLLNKIINFHLDNTNKKEIHVNDLAEGMIVDRVSIASLKLEENLGQTFGLSYQEVEIIRAEAENKKLETVHVTKPFYFAVWLFLGVIITIFVKGSLLSWLLSL